MNKSIQTKYKENKLAYVKIKALFGGDCDKVILIHESRFPNDLLQSGVLMNLTWRRIYTKKEEKREWKNFTTDEKWQNFEKEEGKKIIKNVLERFPDSANNPYNINWFFRIAPFKLLNKKEAYQYIKGNFDNFETIDEKISDEEIEADLKAVLGSKYELYLTLLKEKPEDQAKHFMVRNSIYKGSGKVIFIFEIDPTEFKEKFVSSQKSLTKEGIITKTTQDIIPDIILFGISNAISVTPYSLDLNKYVKYFIVEKNDKEHIEMIEKLYSKDKLLIVEDKSEEEDIY